MDDIDGPFTPEQRAQIAAAQQATWETTQSTLTNSARHTHDTVRRELLSAARWGRLHPAWRDTLGVEHLYEHKGHTRPANPAIIDADELAIHEICSAPVADWEPYASGGDWRAALDAWYAAELDRLAQLQQHHPDLAPILSGARDHCEASYRAGLAAGGLDEDWRGWYRNHITQNWDRADAARQLAIIDRPGFTLATLPHYWLTAAPSH